MFEFLTETCKRIATGDISSFNSALWKEQHLDFHQDLRTLCYGFFQGILLLLFIIFSTMEMLSLAKFFPSSSKSLCDINRSGGHILHGNTLWPTKKMWLFFIQLSSVIVSKLPVQDQGFLGPMGRNRRFNESKFKIIVQWNKAWFSDSVLRSHRICFRKYIEMLIWSITLRSEIPEIRIWFGSLKLANCPRMMRYAFPEIGPEQRLKC